MTKTKGAINRRLLRLVPIASAIALGVTGTALAVDYPSPPPDFAHRADPHSSRYSFLGGGTDRPMLVVYAEFADVPYPSGQDAGHWAQRFFGPFPSVADYFADNSFGDLTLSPATESDASNGGAANDGVVSVSIESDKRDFLQMGFAADAKALLQAADPEVDFSDFDANGDGELTNLELVVHRLDTDDDATGGCGTTRGVDPVTLDGVDIELQTSNGGTDTNLMTFIHETGHVAFDMSDRYRAGVGRFDIAGPTCNHNPTSLRRVTAWQSFHLGWSAPYVVTRDGFALVNESGLAGESFVLYDPSAGTNDYYVVENRVRQAGTYDEVASDTGLVIWKIDEALYSQDTNEDRPIDLQRPDGTRTGGCTDGGCYGGSGIDAWDPSDRDTPQRTFAPTSGPSVAVRAIPAASGSMRVFFDVPGPGVLVDSLTEEGVPLRVDVTPEEPSRPPIRVMNTGEATDDFRFSYRGLPSGWSDLTHRQALGDHEETRSRAAIVPAADAPTGVYEVSLVGQSETDESVREQASLEVNVVLDRTEIAYTGDTRVPTNEPATLSALVTNPDDDGAPPVEGADVTFEIAGPGGTRTVTSTTRPDGIASTTSTLNLPPGDYVLTVSTERHGKHAPASTTVGYRVPTVAERIEDLRADATAADLPRGLERSLTAKLDRALADQARDPAGGCNALRAFVNQVEALRDRQVPAAAADELVAQAESIRAQLGC